MEFQLCRASIALAGDTDQVVVRHRGIPLVFPEVIILQHIHGEDAVSDLHVVGAWETSQAEVLERIKFIYGEEVVKAVFPGSRPRLPPADSTIPPCELPIFVAPPTKPDNPDPVLKPLDQFTMPASMPRVVSKYKPEDPLPEPSVDDMGGHDADETQDAEADEMGLGLGEMVATQPKAAIPDTTGLRARDNVRGQGTHAPRTADHAPDVAGGVGNPTHKSQTEMRSRERDRVATRNA